MARQDFVGRENAGKKDEVRGDVTRCRASRQDGKYVVSRGFPVLTTQSQINSQKLMYFIYVFIFDFF